jgi:hypothetical protein
MKLDMLIPPLQTHTLVPYCTHYSEIGVMNGNRDKICLHPHQSSRQQENRMRWWSAWFFYTKKMANFISTTVEILFSKAQLDQHTSSSLSWAIIVLVSDSRRHTYDSALQILLCPHNHKYNSVTMHHINPWQTQMNDQPFPSPSSEMLH